MSNLVHIKSGVRQGGILSPFLFNVYVNDLLCTLRLSGLGCHVQNLFMGCIMYADDLLLLSSSVKELQCMMDICSEISSELGITFNANKSSCMIIDKILSMISSLW